MAHLIPSIGSARFDTRGELRLAERLQQFMEENTWIWHNLPVGRWGRHPDFVILNPNQGLLVLEVKDWRLDNILHINKLDVDLMTDRGEVKQKNPLEQARAYMFDVVNAMERDGRLVFPASHAVKGKCIVPFGFGAVFPNITLRQFAQTDLGDVLPAGRCLFRDEMSESADPDIFRAKLWSMVVKRVGAALTLDQFDRVRALLFPEIRVSQIALPLETPPEDSSDDRVLAVMDLAQEQLARSIGDGHRVVRGVAGSGKTLILAFRAEHLTRGASRPVLVLCYSNAIAARIEQSMQARGVEDRVRVSTFHAWCLRMLTTYDIPAPSSHDYPVYEERLAASVRAVVENVERGLIPGGQYEAVLIDEAHDFEPQWLALAAKMVHPDRRSLMIVYDDMQAIFKGRARPVWKQLGIEAQGRTTVLKVNYRNTVEILRLARSFAADIIAAPGVQADEEDAVLLPEDGGRHGPDPEVRHCISIEGEGHAIAEWLKSRRAAGYNWAEMAVLYPEHWIGERVLPPLTSAGIPADVIKQHRNRVSQHIDAVRLISMHAAKGLEFPCVAVTGLGQLGARESTSLEDDVRLTYVAVTRATHEAIVTYSKPSPLVQRLIAPGTG